MNNLKKRVSLVDIRIPEQYFEFTKDQAIGDDGRYGNQLKIARFSKHLGKYNARRLQQVLNDNSLNVELGLEISITVCLSDNTIKGSSCFRGINQKIRYTPQIKTF